ncbi:tautomerase family protein [Actinomycetospora sp. TBRC 11914]|uniref:tautomerase family protein n=1 Tax=Actinomycetospora sp. TBRC 11914 TaxID=2729387 RepID=UPI00145C9392|nr:tautomerase family protein [Actinomycetospora sp. TBRC 11914]NMO94040.1 hypothetical protein [Actinomycetospora sp. TBRC 11914]
MPYVEVKVFEERFEDETFAPRMVEAITRAVSSVIGDEAGGDATVIVEGVPRSRWGHGGKTMG